MIDLLFVSVTTTAFGLGAWFVRACDRLIGPDASPAGASVVPAPTGCTEVVAR